MAIPSKGLSVSKEVWKQRMNEMTKPPIMQGELKTISLADVLQLLSSREGRHVVEVVFGHGVGKIFLEGEFLHYAEVVGDDELEGLEALRLLVNLSEGHFEVRKPVVWPEGNLSGPVQALLIEAVRLADEAEAGISFNEELFDTAFEGPPETSPPVSPLEELKEKLPEVDFLIRVSPEGEVFESIGQGVPEELSGVLSYATLHLKEMGNLLGLGELKGFAASGKRLLWAALLEDEGVIGLGGKPRKGLIWWSKKLVEIQKGRTR